MKSILFTILIYLIPSLVFSCSCGGFGNFCETINKEGNENLTIIGGRKISENDFKMVVEVLTVFRGKENRLFITVQGDRGADCLVYTSTFNVGEILLLALFKREGENKYYLSSCGQYFKRCNLSLNCLSENICGCSTNPKLKVYPVPSTGTIYTSINQEEEVLDGNINIYNTSGQIVRKLRVADQQFIDSMLVMNLSDLTGGVYFIQYSLEEDCKKVRSEKIMILNS